MPLPSGDFFFVQAVNPGIDGCKIFVIMDLVYNASPIVVTVDPWAYQGFTITLTIGFIFIDNITAQLLVDWDTIASAVNSAAGDIVEAFGAAGNLGTAATQNEVLNGGTDGAMPPQYYSAGVVTIYNFASAGGSLATQGNYASG